MTEPPTRQAVIVGVFVTLGVVLFAGGILTIGSLSHSFHRTSTVRTTFADVRGLDVASSVWFSGVKVGTVRDLSFGQGSEVEVDLAIDRAVLPHIPADSLTKISTDALLGNQIVVIYDGTPGAPPLAEGDVLRAGTTPSTEDMLAMLQQNNANLLAVTSDLREITASLTAGKGTAGQLLTDDSLYVDLRSGVSDLQHASASARELTASLATFSGKLNRKGSLPNDLVTDQGTYASITESAKNLQAATERAQSLVSTLDERARSTDSAVGTLLSDPQAAEHLQGTLERLDRSSVLLEQDLEALQHNFLLRGWFRKQEKQRAREGEEQPAPAEPAPTEEPPPPPPSTSSSLRAP